MTENELTHISVDLLGRCQEHLLKHLHSQLVALDRHQIVNERFVRRLQNILLFIRRQGRDVVVLGQLCLVTCKNLLGLA